MLGSKKGIVKKRSVSDEKYSYLTSSGVAVKITVKPMPKRCKGKTERNSVTKFILQIKRELIRDFGKTEPQAQALVVKSDLQNYLSKHPIVLHDSPHEWAVKLLTKHNDVKTLEHYYMS